MSRSIQRLMLAGIAAIATLPSLIITPSQAVSAC